MATPIIISEDAITEEDLRAWIEYTRRVTGSKIEIKKQVELTAEDPAVQRALRTLFAVPEPTTAPERRKQPKIAFQLPSAPPQSVRAWRILGDDGKPVERISVEERDLRLKQSDFPTGTVLHHPKAGKFRVIGRMGGDAQTLTEAV